MQKASGRCWQIVGGVIVAQRFKGGPQLTLNASPLNVSDPDGFHRRRCIGKFLFGKVERRHIDDPLPQFLEGNALLSILDEHSVQQETQVPGDREALLPK